jgi:hypothetical protein
MNVEIGRDEMSDALRHSTGSIGTVAEVTKYATEVESLMSPVTETALLASDPTVEDPNVFALEGHLEEFLVTNWDQTPLGLNYRIYEEERVVAVSNIRLIRAARYPGHQQRRSGAAGRRVEEGSCQRLGGGSDSALHGICTR